MMKKISIIAGCLILVGLVTGCNKARRNPGRAYMPDMSYSRAYETYASTENLKEKNIHYNGMPVPGTVARGDMFAYTLANDSSGYAASAGVSSPVNADSINMIEAERLYLINCGICHGTKLDGNGPLWNNGDGAYTVAPKNLMGDDMKKLGIGTIFHVETYGKGQMGSYASQLSTRQRWEIAAYVKAKQAGGANGKDSAMKTSAPLRALSDSAAAANKTK